METESKHAVCLNTSAFIDGIVTLVAVKRAGPKTPACPNLCLLVAPQSPTQQTAPRRQSGLHAAGYTTTQNREQFVPNFVQQQPRHRLATVVSILSKDRWFRTKACRGTNSKADTAYHPLSVDLLVFSVGYSCPWMDTSAPALGSPLPSTAQ